jgi:predicted dinucleotide-binding enzyme
MFICGNDASAKVKVTEILRAFGWDVVDIGGTEGARYLEPLAMVWILHGMRANAWNHAFKLLRKP